MRRKSVKAAAIRILKEAGEPLHNKEIARRAIEHGYWRTSGKTPEATFRSQISVDINRMGEKSPFYRAGPGIFGLRSST